MHLLYVSGDRIQTSLFLFVGSLSGDCASATKPLLTLEGIYMSVPVYRERADPRASERASERERAREIARESERNENMEKMERGRGQR